MPGCMGQGLPSALSSIWGCLYPLLGVTALPSAELLSHGWDTMEIGASGTSPGVAVPAAASCQAEGTGRHRQLPGGQCLAVQAWSRAPSSATKPWTAPDPASAGSAQTVSWHRPPSSKHPQWDGWAAAASAAWLGLLCPAGTSLPHGVTSPHWGQTVQRVSDKG